MINWDDSVLTGIPSVDRDHKRILGFINEFVGSIEANANTSVIHGSFRRMEATIYRHIADEEKMLEAIGYDGTVAHIKVHDKLTDDLEDIWNDMLESPDFRPAEAAKKWIQSWLFIHVRTDDFKYRDWIVAAGREEEADQKMIELQNR